jgi:hypothetical protein
MVIIIIISLYLIGHRVLVQKGATVSLVHTDSDGGGGRND